MTDGGTPLDLEAIKARADAATEGPWFYDGNPSAVVVGGDGRSLCASAYNWPDPVCAANATFIAAARSDVPALVAEVSRLRDAVDAVYQAGWGAAMKAIRAVGNDEYLEYLIGRVEQD
jgi:hypothetical protein